MFRRRNTAATTPSKTATPVSSGSAAINPDARMSNGTVVADRYLLEKTIGKGSYGKVKLATDLTSGQHVAIKFISRSSIKKPAHSIRIRREINLLTALHHPHIVRLHQTVETPYDIILVMEYVEGADLFERIVGHAEKRYGEAEGRTIFEQIVSAIEYCHQHRVIHRDLKPENVMVGDDGAVKLIDFGFANMFHPRGYLETNCGSPLYAAPEIVQGVRYVGPEVDVWSLGVILFAILTGTLPFEDEQLKGLYAKICAGSYIIPSFLSAGAKDLLRKMLCIDPAKRITIDHVATHPWVHHLSLPPRPHLFSRPAPVYQPNEQVLQMMESFGFANVDETRFIVATDAEDPATSIYHLLVEKQERERENEVVCASRPLSTLLTPPPTPAKLFSPTKVVTAAAPNRMGAPPKPLSFPSTPDSGIWVSGGKFQSDLAVPVIVAPPMQMHMPAVSSTLRPEQIPTGAGGPETDGNSIFSSPASIVSQAAASVASHFKRLRGLAFIPRANESDNRVAPDLSTQYGKGANGRNYHPI